jgi:hypothetical protein
MKRVSLSHQARVSLSSLLKPGLGEGGDRVEWARRDRSAPHLRFCTPPTPSLLGGPGAGLGRQRCPRIHGSLLLLRPARAPPPARSQLPWEWATPGTAPSLSPAGPHPRPAAAHAGICVTRPRVGGSRSGEWSKSGISRCDSARGGAGAAEVAGEGEGEAEGGAAGEA